MAQGGEHAHAGGQAQGGLGVLGLGQGAVGGQDFGFEVAFERGGMGVDPVHAVGAAAQQVDGGGGFAVLLGAGEYGEAGGVGLAVSAGGGDGVAGGTGGAWGGRGVPAFAGGTKTGE